MKVAYITNASPQSGVGKPAREIAHYLKRQPELRLDEFSLLPASGRLPKPLQWWWLSHRLPRTGFDVWHFTNQTLSFIPRPPAVVTVHDLIEVLEPQTSFARPVARFLYSGIPRAAHLICVSRYTQKTVEETYGVPRSRITVIGEPAAPIFQPDANATQSLAYLDLLHALKLTPKHRLVLYVGSEHPRKNLPTLVQAFSRLHARLPQTILLKVGGPGLAFGRQQFLAELNRHHLHDVVRFLGHVDDDTLKLLYNVADLLIFPSRFEGFGIPPLEAMAAGCPVVCSNATSLPEVVGDAALLHDPDDVEGFATSMERILATPSLAQDLRQRGFTQAARFNWQEIAKRTLAVYHQVAAEKT